MTIPEAQARLTIDSRLAAVGWNIVPPDTGILQQPTAICDEEAETSQGDWVLSLDDKAFKPFLAGLAG